MKGFLSTLFVILLLRNVMETMIPEGKVTTIAKGAVRVLCFVWILGAVGALLRKQTLIDGIDKVTGAAESSSMDLSSISEASAGAVWIREEYKAVLQETALDPLSAEGMVIADMEVLTDDEGHISKVEAVLQSKALTRSLVEIQIQDITLQDPAAPLDEDYQKLLSEIWGIPMETIEVHIRE